MRRTCSGAASRPRSSTPAWISRCSTRMTPGPRRRRCTRWGMLARAIELHAAPCLLVLDEVDRLPRRTVPVDQSAADTRPGQSPPGHGVPVRSGTRPGHARPRRGGGRRRGAAVPVFRPPTSPSFSTGRCPDASWRRWWSVTAGWPVALLVYRNMRAHEAKGLGADAERLTENYVGVRLLRGLSASGSRLPARSGGLRLARRRSRGRGARIERRPGANRRGVGA